MIFSTCTCCQRSSNPRRQHSMPVALPTLLQIPCIFSFHHYFVPQLRAQLFTYHHLQPSLPSFPYLCFNRRITSVGAHPGELIFQNISLFSSYLSYFTYSLYFTYFTYSLYSAYLAYLTYSVHLSYLTYCLYLTYIFTKSKFTYI